MAAGSLTLLKTTDSGSSWALQSLPTAPSLVGALKGLSCEATTDCVAVAAGVVFDTTDGSTWYASSQPLSGAGGEGGTGAVSCASVTDCFVAGVGGIAATATGGIGISAPPTGMGATAGQSTASLSWTAPVFPGGAAVTYDVYQSTSSGTNGSAIKTGLTTTSYTASGLTDGTTYYFEVVAVNSAGSSSPTPQVSATPQA
ncbi:MAG: fibronectin type III domain-containing protein, partial [Acidimicrobiales bacterium]